MGRKAKEKRNFWNNEEIKCMLEIIKEIQQKRGTTATTHYTFLEIDNEMKKKGFTSKSAIQIRRKWFQMKSAYHCAKKGNIDRLLLIPEEFREEIKYFVESETKGFKEITLTSQESEFFTSQTKTNVNKEEICSESDSSDDNNTKIGMETNKTKNYDNRQLEKGTQLNMDAVSQKSKSGRPTKSVYQKKFSKFSNRLENANKSVQNEFIRQQWELMRHEHKLQTERDKQIIDAFVRTTYEVLNASQSLMRRIYSIE